MAAYVDRFLRFPHRAAALAFADGLGVQLGAGQTAAGGAGWALTEAGAGGVLRTEGVGVESVDEHGEPVVQWSQPPAAIPGYHVIFAIRADHPRAGEILASIDGSGFVAPIDDAHVRWA